MEVLQFSEQQTKCSQQFESHTKLQYSFHFNVLISCSLKFFFGAEIVRSFFPPASISYSCSGINAATSFLEYLSKDTATKIPLKWYDVWEEYFSANSNILHDIFSKWGRAQETGWTPEQSKFCLLVIFDVTVLLNISFSQHFDVLIQLERALGLETHSHALGKTASKTQSLTVLHPEEGMFWDNQMLPTQDQKIAVFCF